MTYVLHRELKMPTMASIGAGSVIRDQTSRPYLDLSSGAGVTCLGYDAMPVKLAMHDQLERLPYVHSGNWTTINNEKLASDVVTHLNHEGFNDGGVMFLSSGAEAVEAACKLARQYFAESGNLVHPVYAAKPHSYHGNTIFTLGLGDHPRKVPYSPTHVPVFRFKDLVILESSLKYYHDRGIPVIVVTETVGGTTVGIQPPTAEYLANLRSLCTQYQAVLIYDEVLCGNYRTGYFCAWQYYQQQTKRPLQPDIIAMGKGLTAGYFPLSAVVASNDIDVALHNGSGRLWHSTTNQNHPLGCAAGVAALYCYSEATEQMDTIRQTLDSITSVLLSDPYGKVVGVTGVGTLRGIHLDPANPGLHKRARKAAMDKGLSIYTEGQTVDGEGNFILLAPPYCMTGDELGKACDILKEVLADVK